LDPNFVHQNENIDEKDVSKGTDLERVDSRASVHSLPAHPETSREFEAQEKEFDVPEKHKGTVQALMDMGFNQKDSIIATEISKNSLERAIAILLETPNVIQDYILQKEASDSKMKMSHLFQLRKSNSMTFTPQTDSPLRMKKIPSIDWSQKRSFSSPKLAGESKAKKPSTSPFSKVGNFLEKAMDAFRVDDVNKKENKQEENLSDTFTVFCGGQQVKTRYNVQLHVLDISTLYKEFSDPLQETAIKASTHQSLYSNFLSGVIMLVRQCDLKKYKIGKTANKGIRSLT
jgi:hypothetical protein